MLDMKDLRDHRRVLRVEIEKDVGQVGSHSLPEQTLIQSIAVNQLLGFVSVSAVAQLQ